MIVLFLFGLAERKSPVYYYLADEDAHDQVEEAIPEYPQLLPKYETQDTTEEYQEKYVTHRSLFYLQSRKGKDEDVVNKVCHETDYAQR